MSFLPPGNNIHRGQNLFVPDSNPIGQAFWFDFTNPLTMYKDTAGTLVTADGDDITVIRDANGTAICLRENPGVPYLTYKVAVINGNSVGRGPGGALTTHFHSAALTTAPANGIPTGGQRTLAQIFTAGKNAMTAIAAVNFTADASPRHFIGDDVGGFWYSRYVLNAGQCEDTFSCFDAAVDKQVVFLTPQTTWAVLTWRQGLTQNQARRNGAPFSSIACTGPATLANFFRFSSGFTFAPFLGDIAELALFPSALSDADCLQVERFFGSKVGIVI